MGVTWDLLREFPSSKGPGMLGVIRVFMMLLWRPAMSASDNPLQAATGCISLQQPGPSVARELLVAMDLVPFMPMGLRVPVDPAGGATKASEAKGGVLLSAQLSLWQQSTREHGTRLP